MPRGEYLHSVIEKDKLNNIVPLDNPRECCCYNDCPYSAIPGTFRNVLVNCSAGCHMRFHADLSEGSCWKLCAKTYKKLNGKDIEHSQPCIKQSCKGTIVSIAYCIGFETVDAFSNDEHEYEEDDEDEEVDANDVDHFDLEEHPPSGFDVFCKESMSPDNRSLRPRAFESKWRALSKPKRGRYDERARLLQYKWVKMMHRAQALDYCFADEEHSSSPSSMPDDDGHDDDEDGHDRSSSDDDNHASAQASNDQNEQENRKKILAQQRQKRIEDMISQNPNIYDDEEMQRRKRDKEREDHRKKTEKLLNVKKKKKKRVKNKKKSKAKSSTVSLSALNDIADQWASEKPLRSPSMTPSHHSFDSQTPHALNDPPHHNHIEAPPPAQQSQPQHQHQHNHHVSNGHVPAPQLNPPTSKLQQWVSLAKQPKFNSMASMMQQNNNAAQQQQNKQQH